MKPLHAALAFGAGVATLGGAALAIGRRSLRTGADRTSSSPPRLAPGDGVLLLGDSHAVGLHTLGHLGGVIGNRSAASIIFNEQPVGATGAPYWRAYIGAPLAQYKPRVVLLSLGGNDFQRTDPANVAAAIDSIVQQVRAAGAVLVWLEPTIMPFADPHDVRGMWLAAGVVRFPTLELEPLPRVGDKIHLTREGYQSWADAIGRWLLP